MKNNIENLYKKGSNESSPTALDNLILNAAKQSCDKKTVKKNQSKNWLYAVSTAAVLVMGLSVVFNLQDQNSEIKTITQDVLESPIIEQEKVQTQTVSTPPLEPHLRTKKKSRFPSPKKENFAGARLGKIITRKPTRKTEADTLINEYKNNKPIPAIVNKSSPVAGIVEQIDEKIIMESSSEEEIKVIRLRAAKSTHEYKTKSHSTLSSEITKLEELIAAKEFEQAKELLVQLKKQFPNYDFSIYTRIFNP